MTPEERLLRALFTKSEQGEPGEANGREKEGHDEQRDRREWRKDPCDPRYVSIEKIYYANGNSLNCKGCGALIEAGDGNCPWCERGYRK